MTTHHRGQMRQIYPESGDAYGYRMDQGEGTLTFELESVASDDVQTAIILVVESHEVGEGLCRTESGRTHAFTWAWIGSELHLWLDGSLYVFQRVEPASGSGRRRSGAAAGEGPGDVLAPMPGAILEVLVAEGDRVERNQTVVLMESMKMELVITAPRDGVVRRVSVEAGQQVERGMRLLELGSEDVAES